MKNNRLFGIVYLLLSNNTVTAKSLAQYFEVSVRTIYRDIETLSELNIPIYMHKGKNGGISLLDNYKFDKTLLTDKEQNQILFSLQGINKLNISDDSLLKKMKTIFSKNDENWFEVDFSVWGNSNIYKKNFEIIKTAIINKNVIKFDYFSSYGSCTNREVEPLKLYFKYNSWYLYSFDRHKKDYRLFKIMRIKKVVLTNESFERVIIEESQILNDPPKIIKIVLKINKELSYRVYDEFEETNITKLENGDFIVSLELPLNDWVYGYILSFGEHIKVLEPTDIRDKIIDKLKKNLDNYL